MEIKTNGEYHPCQYGLTVNLSPDSKILSKSEMYVVRGETPEEVQKAFQELQALIINGKEVKPEKEIKNNPGKEKKQDKKEEKVCPQCGGMLIEKSGISKKNGFPFHFWGCSNFQNGCKFSKPFISEAEEHVLCDQDLDRDMIDASRIPF